MYEKTEIHEALRCLGREAKLRRIVFPARVQQGKITAEIAHQEIETIDAIAWAVAQAQRCGILTLGELVAAARTATAASATAAASRVVAFHRGNNPRTDS